MTTWNAMTVAGIALIAGGLTILVVFRRVLWGSGTSRVHPVRVTRRDADPSDAAPSRSTRHRDAVARPDPEPEPWWGEDADAVAAGVGPSGPPPRAVRRRLRRATPEDGRLASIGLADDEDAPVHDGPVHDGPVHDGAVHEGLVHDGPVHDAAMPGAAGHDAPPDEVGEAPVDDLVVVDAARAHPVVEGGMVEDPGADHQAGHAADAEGRRDAGERGVTAPVDEPPPVTSLEPALHRFAHLGSVGATPGDDRAHRHSDEAEGGDQASRSRPAGYRYGDRVDGWVRPDRLQQPPAEREPLPAGEYWLPVSDPYADSGYGDHGYGVAPREVAPYEPVPHDVVPHTMSSYEIAPVVEPMPSPPFDASGVPTGERNRPGRDGWRTRSRHASPIDPPSPHFSLFGTPPPTAGAPPFGSRYPGIPLPDEPPPVDQPVRRRAEHPRAEGRRRHPAGLPPVTGETTQKLPPLPAGEGQPRPEPGRGDGGRPRESEPAGRPRPRPRPRPSGAAQVDEQRQANRSTVYVSRHAAEPG